jgi:hypothetical protein
VPITQTNFHFTVQFGIAKLPCELACAHSHGQREEADIGLYDYKARWLALAEPMLSDSFGIANDAQLGRFVQPDPIVPNPGDPQSLNRYSYAKNNPVRFTDPSGHWYYDPGMDALVHTKEGRNEYPQYMENPKDVTNWLLSAMNYYTEIPEMRVLSALTGPNKAGIRLTAFGYWYKMVRNRAPLDVKRKMERGLGPSTMIADHWYEYSTAGNILFGFLSEAAGFDPIETHGGAGAAQIWDYAVEGGPIGPVYTGFDQVDDFDATRFGRRVFENAYVDDGVVTQGEFFALMADFTPLTRHGSKDTRTDLGAPTYDPRHFEGRRKPEPSSKYPTFQ